MKQELFLANTEEKKQAITAKKLVHLHRARKFHTLLDEQQDDSTVTLCFDLMQNQELPRTPVGEAYYARQQWQYFFGIVRHHGKGSTQRNEDVTFYTWGEHQGGRGPNEIGSAILDYLRNKLPTGTKRVRLFSDSCGGQNKNFSNLAMMSAFSAETKIDITYFFPVRGHSYLPADRAFGRVEQRLRRLETILLPEEYIGVFREVGTVMIYPQDWAICNLKQYAQAQLKSKQTFLLSNMHVLEINGNTIGTKPTFYGNVTETSMLKRGKKYLPFSPQPLPSRNTMKKAKKDDVLRLLGVIGITDQHPAYSFYSESCQSTDNGQSEASETDAE